MGEANKGRVNDTNIEVDKKAGARATTSSNNSADSGDKITN